MGNIVYIDQIKDHLIVNPPEVKRERRWKPGELTGLLGLARGLFRLGGEVVDIPLTANRIYEVIQSADEVHLSGRDAKVVAYSREEGFYEAKYVIKSGEFGIVKDKLVDMSDFRPEGPLGIFHFWGADMNGDLGGRGHGPTTTLVQVIMRLSEGVPVLEVGNHQGDSGNRYLPHRKYVHV